MRSLRLLGDQTNDELESWRLNATRGWLAAMDDRAETQRIEERLPQGTDEWLARPRLSTTSRGTITPVAILQPLSAPVGDVVMYTGPL